MPDPLARHVASAFNVPDVAAYIARRVDELGLREAALSDTARDTQKPSRIQLRVPLALAA